MNRRRIGWAARFAVAVVTACGLAQLARAESSGSVALRVDAAGKPAASGTPVGGGVPFPLGVVSTVEHLRLKTAQGSEVPAHYRLLSSWPDGSVKAALISLVPAPSIDRYDDLVLDYGPTVSHSGSGPVQVSQDSQQLTITAGLLRVRLSKQRFTVLEQAWTDLDADGAFSASEQWLAAPADLVIEDRKTGSAFRSSLWTSTDGYAPRLIEVSPRQVTVLLEGRVKGVGGALTVDGDATILQAKVWLTVAADSSVVRLQTTLVDTKSRPTETFSDRILKLSRIAVEIPTTLTGANYAAGGENSTVYQGAVGSGAHLLQDGTASFSTTFSHTFSYSGVGSGAGAPGWMDVSMASRGLMVGLRHFWQTYPHKLAMTGGGVFHLDFLPSESDSYFYTVYPGVGKTYEAFLDLHAGAFGTNVRRRAELMLAQPMLIASDPAWYTKSKVFGPLSPRSTLTGDWEVRVERQYNCTVLRQGCSIYPLPYGQRNFGDYQQGFGTSSSGGYFPIYGDGHYEDAHGLLLQFARSGDRRWFDAAQPMARHHYDLDVMHAQNPPRYPGYPPGMIHWHGTNEHEGVNIELGHVVPGGLDEYYYLTGDWRALEVIREQGDWVEYWARAGRGRIAPEKSGDGIGLEEYERVGAWTLYTVLKAYEVTGDPKYWEGASILAKNTVDWWRMPQDHIVFDSRTLDLTRPPQEQAAYYQRSDWTQGNGYPLPTLRVANCPQSSAPINNYAYQTHAAIGWMSGLLQTALIRYYQDLEPLGGSYSASVQYRGSATPISVDAATMREMFIQMAKFLVDYNYLGAPDFPSKYPWLKDYDYNHFIYSVCPGRDPRSTDGGTYLQWPLLFVSSFTTDQVSTRWQSQWSQLQTTFRTIAMRQYQKYVVDGILQLTGYNGVPDLWNEPFAIAQMEALGLLDGSTPLPSPTPSPSPSPSPSPTPAPAPAPSGSDTTLPPYQVLVNDGNPFITDPSIVLKITAPSAATEVNVSPSGYGQGSWQAVDQVHGIELPPGAGAKTLYVQFRDSTGALLASLMKSLVLLEAGFSGEVPLVINDAQDTHLFQNKSDSNYGGQTSVVFGTYATGYDYWGLLSFAVPAAPAGLSITVQAAMLSVYLTDNTRNTSQVIAPRQPLADWNENTVTWNARPALAATAMGSGLTFTSRSEINRWKTFTLDPVVVQSWFHDAQARARGMALVGEGTPGLTSLQVVASEAMSATEDRRPQLALRLVVSVADSTAPVIREVQVTALGERSATVQWTTDEPADGLVAYGTTTAYGMSAPAQTSFSTSHAVELSGLNSLTSYHARITSRDAAGNQALSADITFTTTGVRPGDLNSDGVVTMADLPLLVGQLLGISATTPATADVNADGRVTIADVQTLVNLL